MKRTHLLPLAIALALINPLQAGGDGKSAFTVLRRPLSKVEALNIALAHNGDWNMLVTGDASGTTLGTVWSTAYGEGLDLPAGNFGSWLVQFQSDSSTAVTAYQAPFLVHDGASFRASFVEIPFYTGGVTRTYWTYLHPDLSWVIGALGWRAPVPTDHHVTTGLALATGLMRRGIQPLVVDKLPAAANTSRAAVIHAHTLDVLERLGVGERLSAAGLKLARFSIRDRDRALVRLRFDQLPSAHAFLLMLPQDVTDLVPDVLRHRLVLSYEAMSDGQSADSLIARVMRAVPLPEKPLESRLRAAAGG